MYTTYIVGGETTRGFLKNSFLFAFRKCPGNEGVNNGKHHDRRKGMQGLRALRGRMPEKGYFFEQTPHERERVFRCGKGQPAKLHRVRVLRDHVPRLRDRSGEIELANFSAS